MKRLLVGAALVGSCFITVPASAADIPLKGPPVAPVVYGWTGWYFGVNAGYSHGETKVDYFHNQPIPNAGGVFFVAGVPSTFATSPTLHPDGGIIGIQLGYSWQHGSWLFGIEADIALVGGEDSSTFAGFNVFNDRFTLATQNSGLGTVRARVGVLASPNSLLYVTGGFAYGPTKHTLLQLANAGGVPNLSVSTFRWRTGWTVGAGWEWMFAPKWSIGLEYLYVDLGTDSFSTSAQLIGGLTFPATSVSFHDVSHIGRVKINRQLHWGL